MEYYHDETNNNYQIIKYEELDDLQGTGYYLIHKKTKAKLILIKNNDPNLVFSIGFKTIPENSRGVAHVVEHAIFRGSRNFATDDLYKELSQYPFIKYMNAMTYPDKTKFIFSCLKNKVYKKLIMVYLDAVFNPNFYNKTEIIEQEGWHYILPNINDSLSINGIVYNEMKAEYSQVNKAINREILKNLFPETFFCYDAGGNPEEIINLTHKECVEFHKKYYHPSNSIIYLYGDINMNGQLILINKLLNNFEERSFDKILYINPVKTNINSFYLTEEKDLAKNKIYYCYSIVISEKIDSKLYYALDILGYIMFGSTKSLLKNYLNNIYDGCEIEYSINKSLPKVVLSIIIRANLKVSNFSQDIQEVINNVINSGLNKSDLLFAINKLEVKVREGGYHNFPTGVAYEYKIYDELYHDEANPFEFLKYKDTFKSLKDNINNTYFESILFKYFINPQHSSCITLRPEAGTNINIKKIQNILDNKKLEMDKTELEAIISRNNNLSDKNKRNNNKSLSKLLSFSKKSIKYKNRTTLNNIFRINGVEIIHNNSFTNNICYISLMFNTKKIPIEYLNHLGLLHNIYSDFNRNNNANGEITTELSVYPINKSNDFKAYFEIKIKCLYSLLDKLLKSVNDIIFNENIDLNILYNKLYLVNKFITNGLESNKKNIILCRSLSYVSQSSKYIDEVKGYNYYRYINALYKNYNNQKNTIYNILKHIKKILFCKENLTINIISDEIVLKNTHSLLSELIDNINYSENILKSDGFLLDKCNEGFIIPSGLQYMVRSGNFINGGFVYTGLNNILGQILRYEYLLPKLRYAGYAYDCSSKFSMNGETYFITLRDSNMSKSNSIIEQIPDYLMNFKMSDHDFNRYIFSVIKNYERNYEPYENGKYSICNYIQGITDEDLHKEFESILYAKQNDICKSADMVDYILKSNYICAIGDKKSILDNGEMFYNICEFIKN